MNRKEIIRILLEQTQATQKELLELKCNDLIGIGRELDVVYPKRTVRIENLTIKRQLMKWNRERIESDGCMASFLGIKKRQLMKDVKIATNGKGIIFYR